MLKYFWRRALSCYHCARPAGFLVFDLDEGRRSRYQAEPGETRPQRGHHGRPVCGHCKGPLYQGEAERVFPLEAVEPEPPRKRGRPRKHPLPVDMPASKAS